MIAAFGYNVKKNMYDIPLLSRRAFGRLAFGAAVASAARPLAALAGDAGACRLRIGVLSDIHLTEATCARHFRKALKWFDARKADGVIIAGDLGYNGLIREMKVVADVWREVFPNDVRSDGGHVEKLFITGNHDVDGYFYHQKDFPKVRFPVDPETAKDSFVFNRRRVWKELFGEEYETVKVKEVKGYKFVLFQWYPRLAADVCSARWIAPPPDEPVYNDLRYESSRLDAFFAAHGEELRGERPFFFIQHNHPGDTLYSPYVYGSPEGWGEHDCGASTRFLKDYPNCVCFSGHSHTSPVFEQSIWQGAFTSVETSACPGWAMAGAAGNGRANCSWGDKAAEGTQFDCETPKVGQLMCVYDDRIVIENREFSTDEALTDPREFPWPISRGRPYAYDPRRAAAVPPEFPADAKLVRREDDRRITLTFPTVRRENAGRRAIDYEVTCVGRWTGIERIVEQRRVYSQGLALPESHDRGPVTVVFSREELAKTGAQSFRFEVRPCDSWDKKGRAICA